MYIVHVLILLTNTVAGVDGETNFGGFLTRKVPKSTNEVEEVAYVMHVHMHVTL